MRTRSGCCLRTRHEATGSGPYAVRTWLEMAPEIAPSGFPSFVIAIAATASGTCEPNASSTAPTVSSLKPLT